MKIIPNRCSTAGILRSETSRKSRLPLSLFMCGVLIFCAVSSTALAQSGKEYKTMGAATCASSNCHGSVSPRNSTNVMQNEYTTWYKHGAHAQAYKVLANADSKRIGKHLGIGSPQSAPLCLECHATYVPDKSKRGRRYRLSDGVGCESCHGAAEAYLETHTAKTATHADNVKRGLIDLVSLETRAKICLDCHQGTDDRFVNHRLIGAGHPRLTYELDTYGILQPNHWEVDKDYVNRKAAYNPARAWMLGQLMRSAEMLATIASPKRSKQGALPDLSLFYCYNCHHSLKEDQWKSRGYGGRPGELHLNASSMLMVGLGLDVLNPALAESYNAGLKKLHSSYAAGSGVASAKSLRGVILKELVPAVNSTSFKSSVATGLLKKVVTYGANTPYLPYETAEQVAMAVSALSSATSGKGTQYSTLIDGIYDALADEEAFNASRFTSAMQKMKAKL